MANFEKANQLQYVALSRALAGEAMRPSEAPDVPALLARQAYNFAAAHGGDPESPEIVTALRQSLENLATDTSRVLVGHDDAVRALAISRMERHWPRQATTAGFDCSRWNRRPVVRSHSRALTHRFGQSHSMPPAVDSPPGL